MDLSGLGLLAGLAVIAGVTESINCVGIPKEFGSKFSGKRGPASIDIARINEKQMTAKNVQPYDVHGPESGNAAFQVTSSKEHEVDNQVARVSSDAIDNVGTAATEQKVDTAKNMMDSGETAATKTGQNVEKVVVINDETTRGNDVNSDPGVENMVTMAKSEYSEKDIINRDSLQGSSEAKLPNEINSGTSDAAQETGDIQGLHNIDGHYVMVKRQKKLYTKLFFRSKSILVMIERTSHDNYKRCTVFENRTDEDLPKDPNVITIGEEGMAEMVTICKRRDEMRASRTKRFIDIIYPGTKWCGVGNIAENPDDLGPNVEVDKCCRTHDQCPEGIGPFEYKYGLYSTSLFYRSACYCDEAFYNCLKAAGDVVIGNIFFNIVSLDCIEEVYQEVCIKPGWWWTCREYGIDTSKPKIWVFMENMLVY